MRLLLKLQYFGWETVRHRAVISERETTIGEVYVCVLEE